MINTDHEIAAAAAAADQERAPARSRRMRWTGRSAAILLFAATLSVGLAEEYRGMIRSGGDAVPGDMKDTRLAVYLLEHWDRTLAGEHDWLSPPFFYPETGTLGYTDTFLLLAPGYIAARRLGADIYTSFQVTLVLTSIIGFSGMVVLLHRYAGVSFLLSLVGAAVFAFANMMHNAHVQMHAVAFAPISAALIMEYLRRRQQGRWPAMAFGMAAVVLLDLTFFTAFHVGWFTGFLGLATATFLAGIVARGWRPRVTATTASPQLLIDVALLLAVGVLAAAPLLLTYLPTYRAVGGHAYLPELLPTPVDAFNIGGGNALWGHLLAPFWAKMGSRPEGRALQKGFPFALLFVFLVALALIWHRRKRRDQLGASDRTDQDLATVSLGGGIVAAWLMTVRVGHLSAWPIMRRLVPGADAIRGVLRIHFVIAVPLVVVAFIGLQQWLTRLQRIENGPRRWIACSAFGGLIFLLLSETVRLDPADSFSKTAELTYLSAFSRPPGECRSFHARVSPGGLRPRAIANIDASLIGITLGIPTINGPTRKSPTGWRLRSVEGPEYTEHVADWVASNRLEGVCSLDVDNGEWGLPN